MDEQAAGRLIFRPHTPEDLAFLLDSWGSSYYRGTNAYKHISPDEFHAYHRPIRERFLARPQAAIIVCSPDNDEWHILGWIAVEKTASGIILQYLYVKEAFKGQGIAKQLIKRAIPTSPVFFTHLTDRAARIMSKKQDQFGGFIHIPTLV